MKFLNSNFQEREPHQLQQMQDNGKENCMVSFLLLHSHLTTLSNNDLKGTCIKGGFERAFVTLFDQDIQTFTRSMLLNLNQLEKQLDKEEFQKTGSIDAFRALMTQFQTFINFRYNFDDFDGTMICKYFQAHTQTEIREFHNTLIQHMESLREKILERAKHKREKDMRVNERMMQSKERKDNSSNALDADLTYKDLSDSIKKTSVQTKDHTNSLIVQLNCKSVKNADLKAQIQEKNFANASLKNELRKLKENNMDTKFAKPSILGKPALQPPINQSVVRQPNAFKSERPNFSKLRFASQVDVNNVLSKPVTPYYLPKVREYVPAKPHRVNAPSSSRNSKKELYGFNDMTLNYYLEEAKKKTQDKNRNLKPREMPSAETHHTPNACTPKPRSNN
uniref:Integrase, catalytic region, zinc finger, CCHC-type, peptidase aspartic, catalytic n=1 Tax=Tanacetum cinerariifolium TaxID=118510 RepID=A0A6L2MA88_TANCI|nr:hypothetical protein [Tanacetum cinerariifolium]